MRIVNEYSNKTPSLVFDPVILYGYKGEQLKYKPQTNEKYIIVYSFDKNFRDRNTIEQLKALAKKEKCRIYSVGYHHKWCDKNICPDPIEMLGLFKMCFHRYISWCGCILDNQYTVLGEIKWKPKQTTFSTIRIWVRWTYC